MKKFSLKKISQAVALSLVGVIGGLSPAITSASDIEIYKVPEAGVKTVMMMLDISGSMLVCDTLPTYTEKESSKYGTGRIARDGLSILGRPVTVIDYNFKSPNGDSYIMKSCLYDGQRHDSRAGRLMQALITLVDSKSLDNTLVLGIGEFYGGTTGRIVIPAEPLTDAHRAKVRKYVKEALKFGDGTPTANAYAEVAAYMMGTSTKVPLLTTDSPREAYYGGTNGHHYECSRFDKDGIMCDNTGRWVPTSHLEGTGRYIKQQCLQPINPDLTCLRDTTSKSATRAPEEFLKTGKIYTGRDYDIQSGFAHSVAESKSGNVYKSPLPKTDDARSCSGQAIYFLTDGFPNSVFETQYMMRAVLGNRAGDFPRNSDDFRGAGYLPSTDREGMGQVGELAKRLRDPSRNPAGVTIKTAVVGFGEVFAEAENYKNKVISTHPETGKKTTRVFYDCSKIKTREIRNACYWGAKSYDGFTGGYGEGGFFYAKNSEDVVDSLLQVVADVEIKTGELATGSPSIPFDPLDFTADTTAYYASFTPVPEKSQQLWTGNMNKYNVTKGRLLSGANNEPLFKGDGNFNDKATGLWDKATNKKGVLGQLALKEQDKGRIVFTNRKISSGKAENGIDLKQINVSSLYSGDFKDDNAKNYWLNLLGYNVPTTGNIPQTDLAKQAELRQLGATMHSLPVFITQQAKVDEDGKISNREDYIVYGSTQGLLHVVDAKTGKEKLAFAPHEMLEKQKDAFLPENLTVGGRQKLFYGIDAPWVSHAVYTTSSSGMTTVQTQKTGDGAHQWLYGGLRMGGRSYYGLNVSNLDKPELLFHIDPDSETVHGKKSTKYPELQKMGQSWSKPALGYVNWNAGGKAERRLVIFVGGGYDAGGANGDGLFDSQGKRSGYEGYEKTDYQQNNKRGAGVYMFDATTGELLWWASSETVSGGSVPRLNMPELQYSVASRINTLDRDQDGLIDNLYFGDLGGQGFRIDLNNNAKTPAEFAVRGVRLFNEHKADGTSPRFYEMPDLSVYTQSIADKGDGKAFLTVNFASGDRSSPLAGTGKNLAGDTIVRPTAQDGVFVVYDTDVGRSNLYDVNFKSNHTITTLLDSNFTNGVPQKATDGKYNRGWKYIHNALAGTKKFTQEPFTIGNLLFVNAYNKDGQGISGACGAGVAGDSSILSFCMPTGKCDITKHGHKGNPTDPNKPNESPLGVGLQGASVGGDSTRPDVLSIVGGHLGNQDCVVNDPRPHCKSVPNPPKINQLRWYESN